MNARSPLPLEFRAIAILYLVLGVGAVIEVFVRATPWPAQVSFAVLGIPICFGLLRLSRGWRACAMVFAYAELLLVSVESLLILQRTALSADGMASIKPAEAAFGWLFTTAAVVVYLAFWKLSVLTRPSVRRLFHPDDKPAAVPRREDAPHTADS